MDKIVLELLLKNKVNKIASEELKLQISSHPSFPSLHAITGVLDHFGIDNMALDIPRNKEVYAQLPKYFIAQLINDGGTHILFVTKYENFVKIKYANHKKEKLNKTDFLKKWTGIVVVIDENETAATKINKFTINYVLIAVLLSMLIYFFYKNGTLSLFSVSHLLLSVIGVYIGVLLVKHELGINSLTIEKLCKVNKRTSCEAVLKSKGATFFGLFKLSDATFVYFTSLTLAWVLFFQITILTFASVVILSFLALPIIIYSVYYQAVIIKKWCPLCLVTVGILFCQMLSTYFLNVIDFSFNLNGFLILTTSFLSIIILYGYIKPLIASKLKSITTNIDYFKFKRNFSFFKSLYERKQPLNTTIVDLNEIVFGNENAKINILVITNPLCSYCRKIHKAIEGLLHNQNIKVTIRFNIETHDFKDYTYKIATILLNLYQIDKKECKKAMHQVYSEAVVINNWLSIYKDYYASSKYEILEAEKNWANENGINFTPAVYINEREFPEEYELEDLSFFIDDLIMLNQKSTDLKVQLNS